MAQSAIGKNPLHIEGYWEKPSSEAPDWDLWLPQFKFALFTKEEIQHSALIGPKPAKVTVPRTPAKEKPLKDEKPEEAREREKRYSIAYAEWERVANRLVDVGILCNEKVPWEIAERKAKGLLFLCLGATGRVTFTNRNPGLDQETCSYKQFVDACEATFKRMRNLTFDRYKFLTRKQKKEEGLEAFYCELRRLAQYCNLGVIESTMIRDVFTANMHEVEIQKELLKETKTAAEAIELALRLELSTKNQRSIATTSGPAGGLSSVGAISQRGAGRPFRNRMPGTKSAKCPRCGYTHEPGKCPAYGQTCTKCSLLHHFSSCCKTKSANYGRNQQQTSQQ